MIEIKNHADALVHSTEKSLSEHGSAVGAEEKAAIEADLAALKEVLSTDNKDDIQAKMQTLVQSSMKLGEAAYKAAQATEGAEQTPTGESTSEGENIVDAEYEVKDDDRKKA
jgi:molecular chaperone DnaK